MFNKIHFIAEISANHCGSLSHAKQLIRLAKISGADSVKLQTYLPEAMTLNSKKRQFKINSGLWKGKYLWDLYKSAQTPHNWHKELFAYAKKFKITCFSSAFDETSVDLLEGLSCPFYKVASFEMNHIPLIKKIARTKKIMIISTGMATLKEIDFTYKIAKKYGAKEIILLYCVSNYPSKISDFNFNNIRILKERYNCKVGFSDHSTDTKVVAAAVAAGAEVIEKHIALQGQTKGLDLAFSAKGKEIKKYKKIIVETSEMMGRNHFFRSNTENKSKKFRRSIYAIKNIKKGQKFTTDNIKIIRPGYGLSPFFYYKIINKKSPFDIKLESPINSSLLKIFKIKNRIL